MRYVCVEENKVISILAYEPEVPASVSVIAISDEQYKSLEDDVAYFDVVTLTVVSRSQQHLQNKEIERNNAVEREFLNSTDWMVLRQLRQKALGLNTSLTEQEFIELEQQRHDSANRIVTVNTQD